MKTLIFKAVGFLCLLLLANACKKNTKNTPETNCKLLQYSSTSTTPDYTSTDNVTFDYNDKGQNTGQSATTLSKDKNGVQIANTFSSTSYQYDADGHPIKKLYQSQGTSKADGQGSQSNTVDNQFQNGRLTKQIYAGSTTAKGKTITRNITYAYEYDSEGNNTKSSYVDINDGKTYSSTTLYEWKDKKLTKIITIDNAGKQTVPFIEVNANGWITKYIDEYQSEKRYTYDSEGNQLRIENWDQGKKFYVEVKEYDSQKNWLALFNFEYKLYPNVKLYGSRQLHNETKTINYEVDNTGQEKQRYTSINNYQYNGMGYPTNISSTSTYIDGKTYTSSVVVSYKDCQ